MKKLYSLLLACTISVSVFGQSQMCQVQVTANSTGNKCNGQCNGTATAFPIGTGSYAYSWSSGATVQTASGLCAGTYTVTVTDNGNGSTCTGTVTITQPAQLVAALSGNTVSVSCSGKCDAVATIIASGGTPAYTYSWIPTGATTQSVSGLCSVPYQCNVTDANGCKTSVTVIPTSPPVLTCTTTGGAGTATANPSGGTPPYTYSWNPTGQATQTATGLTPGTYTVTITDKNGCTRTATANVTSTGIAKNISNNNISVYPNPASSIITIKGVPSGSAFTISITNILGQVLFDDRNLTAKGSEKQLDVTSLPAGVYMISISSAEGTFTHRFLKN